MKVEAKVFSKSLKADVKINDFTYTFDQQLEDGGENMGANPVQIVASALATCKAMYIKSYAAKKGMKVDEVHSIVDFASEDLKNDGKLNFKVKLEIKGDLTKEQLEKLDLAVKRCAVGKILETANSIEQELHLVE